MFYPEAILFSGRVVRWLGLRLAEGEALQQSLVSRHVVLQDRARRGWGGAFQLIIYEAKNGNAVGTPDFPIGNQEGICASYESKGEGWLFAGSCFPKHKKLGGIPLFFSGSAELRENATLSTLKRAVVWTQGDNAQKVFKANSINTSCF